MNKPYPKVFNADFDSKFKNAKVEIEELNITAVYNVNLPLASHIP